MGERIAAAVSAAARSASIILIVAATAACGREPAIAAVTPAPPIKPVATVQDLMQAQLEPAAEIVWEAVSTTITAAGTEDKQPRTPQEWQALRHQAVTLIEAANLLMIPHRAIAAAGGALEDAHVEGIFTPADIQQAIAADQAAFNAQAQQLHDAGTQVLAAIEAKDVAALVRAGGHLDEACESCHLRYWYPNAPVPPELASRTP